MKPLAVVASSLAAAVAVAALATAFRVPAAAAPPAGTDLLHRMTQINDRLRTYTARIHLDVAMKSFPYISPSLDGNVYFRAPDKQAVVFDTVPSLASQFKKVYPKLDPPVTWAKIYDVTPISDENGTTTFRLIPKKNGRVEHLDVKVDDTNATIKSYTWTYKDGGFITFDQTFKMLGSDYLIDHQAGHVELPSYKADLASSFSNYKLNVAIDDSVFVEK